MPTRTIAVRDAPAFRGWLATQVAARQLSQGRPRLALSPLDLAALAGRAPDPWQAQLLTSTAPRILLNCSRQSGKSTMAAMLAVAAALQPDSLVLLLSRSWRQSSELFKKCLAGYRAAGRPVSPESETALSLTLDNRSRIVSLPGKEHSIRGFSGVSLICIDEASRVPDDLYYAVRPMLAVSGGRLIALSTPFGARGWFYQAWQQGEGWERYEVPAVDCPRISPDFLEEERRTLGEWWYQQEYCCQFMDAQSSMFRGVDIDAAFDEAPEAWAL